MCHILLVCSTLDGNLCWYDFLAIVSKGEISKDVQVIGAGGLKFFDYFPMGGLDGLRYGRSVCRFLGSIQMI